MFFLVATALVLGLVIGALFRGSVSNLKTIQLRWTGLLFASLALGLIPLFIHVPSGVRIAAQLLTNLGVIVFLGANIVAAREGVRAGLFVLALGWALNFLVIAANGAMPLSVWAYQQAGQTDTPTPGQGGFFKIELAGPDTILRPLGDVIPIRVVKQVVSVGDIVLIGGIAFVIAAGMRRAEPETHHPGPIAA